MKWGKERKKWWLQGKDIHGQCCEESSNQFYMVPAPSKDPSYSTVADSLTANCFYKDGRRINVGDCAFFQTGNAAPLIGIIRAVTANKEGNLLIGINRLYRPADIRIAKGALVEAVPNEIFYSFHRDEALATLLLHPCKIAFLPKGVELPSTVSSFVCRRVYDISTKSILWLTDRDYSHEHQDELNELLDKTKHEMQVALPSELSSSKAPTQSTSPNQPKAKSDAMEKSSISSQGKVKKRKGSDQRSDPRKREQSSKSDDSDANHFRQDICVMPEELSSIIQNDGSLICLSSVDQLVQFMQQERNDSEEKLDDIVSRRTMLASVIAATEKGECLDRFIQLGGLPILDNWLQEAHKGKSGDSVTQKDAYKGLEELLLTLLRALDKLPVDLDALKTCIVGKSVNNLRSHKNAEIQKKARKLVDTWKKRVDAEMKVLDESKSTSNSTMSWSNKGSYTDSTDSKAVTTELKLKSLLTVKPLLRDSLTISAANSAGSEKIPTDGSKENHAKLQIAFLKEEKSSSSSLSQNISQSLSNSTGDPAGSNKRVAGRDFVIASTGTKLTSSTTQSYGIGLSSCSTELQKDLLVSTSQVQHGTGVEEKIPDCEAMQRSLVHGIHVDDVNNHRQNVHMPDQIPAHDVPSSRSRGTSSGIIERQNIVDSGKSRMHNGISSTHPLEVSIEGRCGSSRCTNLEFDCAVDKERSHDVTAGNYGKCKVSECEHRLNVEAHEAGKSEAVVVASVDLGANNSGLQISTEESGINLLARVAANASSEVETLKANNSVEQINISLEHHNRVLEIQRKMQADINSLQSGGKDDNSSRIPLADAMQDKISIYSSDDQDSPTHISCLEPYMEASGLQEVAKDDDRGPVDSTTTYREQSIAKSRSITLTNDAELSPSYLRGCENLKGDIGNSSLTVEHAERLVEESLATGNSEDGKRVDTGSEILSRISLAEDVTKADTGYAFAEDALEVARQVAKEVEEEVEQYRKLDQQVDQGMSHQIEERDKNDLFSNKRNTLSSISQENIAVKGKGPGSSHLQATDQDDLRYSCDSQETVTGRKEDLEAERIMGVEESEVNQTPAISGGRHDMKMGVDPILGSVIDVCGEGEKMVCSTGDVQLADSVHINEQTVRQPTAMLSNSRQNFIDRNVNDTPSKPSFDLNEGLVSEEVFPDIARPNDGVPFIGFPVNSFVSAPYSVSPQCPTPSFSVPVSVVAAMKGAVIPPPNLFRSTGEPGWKGSAATSAFRPAEPRYTQQPVIETCLGSGKRSQPLDIDLNVADERLLEDGGIVAIESSEGSAPGLPSKSSLTSQIGMMVRGGIPSFRCNVNCHDTSLGRMLDLNQVDEPEDSASPFLLGAENSGALVQKSNDHTQRVIREFDLNDGPALDDVAGIEPLVQAPIDTVSNYMSPVFTASKSETEYVNAASWYSPANSFAMLAVPMLSAGKPEWLKSIDAPLGMSVLNPGSIKNSCSNDLYASTAKLPRSVPYLSPTLNYSSTTFGSTFPLTSTLFSTGSTVYHDSSIPACFPAVPSLASAGTASAWPHVMGVTGNIGVEGPSWSRTKFDLNTGPDYIDIDDGDGNHQQIFTSPFSIQKTMKRKQPEGGFDSYGPGFNQMWH